MGHSGRKAKFRIITDKSTRRSGAKAKKGGPRIVLFSRGGFTDGLKKAAAEREQLRLVEIEELIPG